MSKWDLPGLPESVRQELQVFAQSLSSILGDNLVALLVFGSAVRGAFRPGHSDVDLVLVLRDASAPTLLSIANTLQTGRMAMRFESMILCAQEIPQAADVFPLFYDDIRAHHVVLVGSDPFSALPIADRHRRLRIEQELREAQIRLRRAVVDGMGAEHALFGSVDRKLKQIRVAMHALFVMKGQACADDIPTLLSKASELYSLDLTTLQRRAEEPARALVALMQLLTALVADVDRMPE